MIMSDANHIWHIYKCIKLNVDYYYYFYYLFIYFLYCSLHLALMIRSWCIILDLEVGTYAKYFWCLCHSLDPDSKSQCPVVQNTPFVTNLNICCLWF